MNQDLNTLICLFHKQTSRRRMRLEKILKSGVPRSANVTTIGLDGSNIAASQLQPSGAQCS